MSSAGGGGELTGGGDGGEIVGNAGDPIFGSEGAGEGFNEGACGVEPEFGCVNEGTVAGEGPDSKPPLGAGGGEGPATVSLFCGVGGGKGEPPGGVEGSEGEVTVAECCDGGGRGGPLEGPADGGIPGDLDV